MRRLPILFLGFLFLLPGLRSQAQMLIKSGATEPIPVFVADSTGAPVTGVAGASFTATVRKPNTGSYVAASGTIAEDGNGVYEYTPTSAETTIAAGKNMLLVHLVVTATATSFGDSAAQIIGIDLTDAVHLGISSLPNAAAGASGGLPTGDGSGRVLLQPVTHTGARIPNVTLADTITTYTGNTVQTGDAFARIGAAGAGLTALGDSRIAFLTGDAFARIGAAGAGLTALGDARLAHLDADVSSRMATFTVPPNFSILSIEAITGSVTTTAADRAAVASAVLSAVVDGGFTLKQCQALSVAVLTGNYTITRNTGAKTITVVYYRPANPGNTTTVLATLVTNYSDTALTLPTTRTVTFSNLP